MRRPNTDHTAQPWLVHALASDFELLDVWRYPVRIAPDVPFGEFLSFLARTQSEFARGRGPAALLFRLRSAIGRILGWDEDRAEPAAAATRAYDAASVRHRLASGESFDAARLKGRTPGSALGFDPVYATEDEALTEIQNDTVHALMHLGRVRLEASERTAPGVWSPQMAVYVKPRGGLGRAYMTLIGPFRHLIVYPAMMRAVERAWPAYAAERAARFARALKAIDAANAEDPHSLFYKGETRPKELLHSQRASDWLEKLAPEAGELLRLAIRAHHLRRWSLPRAEYPMGRAGYHAWRRELQNRHAREAAALLSAEGYLLEQVERVGELIRKRGLGRDPEAQIFEDVLCLVFIETQLENFASTHETEKVVDILARTLPKMSPRAKQVAAELCSAPAMSELIQRAIARAADGPARD